VTDRQTDREAKRQTDRQRSKEAERQADSQTGRGRQRSKEADRQTEKQRGREASRQSDRQRQTEKQRGRQTDRQTDLVDAGTQNVVAFLVPLECEYWSFVLTERTHELACPSHRPVTSCPGSAHCYLAALQLDTYSYSLAGFQGTTSEGKEGRGGEGR